MTRRLTKESNPRPKLFFTSNDSIFNLRFSTENAFSMICLQLEQVNLGDPIYIKPERGTREKKSVLARVFTRDGSPVQMEDPIKLEEWKNQAVDRWNALINRIRQTHGTSAPQRNDETPNDPPSEHYRRLFDRLSEIGATPEWVEWTKGLIAQRKFLPSTLTYEQAKEIFLFVKAKLQSPSQ